MALLLGGGVIVLRRNLLTMFVEVELAHAFRHEPCLLLHLISNAFARISILRSMSAELPALITAKILVLLV
jgi:hypothetical protein